MPKQVQRAALLDVPVAPGFQGDDDRHEWFFTTRCQPIFVSRRPFLVSNSLQDAGLDEPIQAIRQHVEGKQHRRPNSLYPVNPLRCSAHAHTRHQRSPEGENQRPVHDRISGQCST